MYTRQDAEYDVRTLNREMDRAAQDYRAGRLNNTQFLRLKERIEAEMALVRASSPQPF